MPRIALGGARLHLGAQLRDGSFVPLSFAFTDSRGAVTMAIDEAIKQLQRYGEALSDLPLLDEEDGEAGAVFDDEAADLGDE